MIGKMDNSAAAFEPSADTGIVEEVQSDQEVPLENPEVEEDEEQIDVEDNNDSYVPQETSSVQIAPTGESDNFLDYDPMSFVQLGDRVVIDSKKYGRTTGTVYYRSLELISVKPDGASNILHQFEVEQVDGEEVYQEKDEVSAVYIIEKRAHESFVEQQNFRVGQIIDTFDKNGDPANSYKITAVDVDNDVITIQDLDDPDTTQDIEFNFTGIDTDEDFRVITIRTFVSKDENQGEGEEEEQVEEQVDEEDEDEEEEEDEIEIVGFIEVTRSKVYREAASYEQRIPDSVQKIDALNNFILGLDPILQKNPIALRSIRILVETLFQLKQATISYRDDKSIKGVKTLSAIRLSELIESTSIPLGRPVLSIIKKEYMEDDSKEANNADDLRFINFQDELTRMVRTKSQLVSTSIAGAGSIVREWYDQKNFYKEYLSPWGSNGMTEPIWRASTDSEFFRSIPPMSTEENGRHTLLPTIPGYVASHDVESFPVMDEVPFGMERSLSAIYHVSSDRKRHVLFPEESATIESYILFPLSAANYLGKTRSRNINVDSGRSQLQMKTMKMMLESMGAPKEVGSSKDILLLNVEGNTIGNIPLADYIQGLTVPALGLGDTFDTLDQYGMENLELNRETAQVLLNKIDMYQSQLLSTLSTLRKKNQENPPKDPEPNPFLENPTMFDNIRSQPTLVHSLIEYERANISMASSDIGQVQHLLRHFPIYFQVAVGKMPELVGKALLYANMSAYRDRLHVLNTIAYNEKHAGEKPKKNTCRHVADLVSVRKLFNDGDRFHELSSFFRTYQGIRDKDDPNWINCNVCKEHLLCVHETLQLQAYLNPKEKDTLEKEIILKCSGGVFQGKYICRNCGQSIRDLDFDNSLEFDDNGQPKSGRAVLVDEDAELDKRLDTLLSVDIEPSEKSEMNLDEGGLKCYDIIREIAERAGVPLDEKAYRRIITNASNSINKFPSMEAHNKAVKAGTTVNLDYHVALARVSIGACALYLHIEIQTKIPAYVPRYTLMGCKSPGFDGYPLDPNPANRQGIEYIACAVASITRKAAPWNQSGFQSVTDDMKRQTAVVFYMNSTLKEAIKDASIQANLATKRAYLTDVLGVSSSVADSRPKDMIPSTFLPEQMIVSIEEAAKDVIRPDVAANIGSKGNIALVKLWIRQAHGFAKQTVPITRGNPFMEATCCLSGISQTPGHFWKENSELPQIGLRKLMPNRQGHPLLTEFNPRDSEMDVVSADADLYYRIFLKCCFQGLRKGYTHEPGLTNRCHWCNFQFPTHPSVMDTDTEGKTALITQEIATNTAEFTDLLDTIHTVNRVEPLLIQPVSSVLSIMEKFGKVEPAPIANWREIIATTTDLFLKLPPQADRSDVAVAAGTISDATHASMEIINARLRSDKRQRILESIAGLSWVNFFQVVQIYFITPFQRLLTQFSRGSLFIPIELIRSLSQIHATQDLIPILDNDTQLLFLKGNDLKPANVQLARAKIAYFVKQMSSLLPFKNSIRPTVVPGRHITLEYIQRALFFGPLSTLLHSGEIPPGVEIKSPIKSMGDPSMRLLLEIVGLTLDKYDKEHLSFDDKEIKNLIAIRDEKERVNVVAEFNRLTDEERGIELMNKSLGIGKWAVGGTKKIFAYDKDYYDEERQKRLAAGIVEFPGGGNGEMGEPQGREVDDLGFNVYGDEEFEADGGYEHNQHGDDDYE